MLDQPTPFNIGTRQLTPARFDTLLSLVRSERKPQYIRPPAGIEVPTRMLGVPLRSTHPGGSIGDFSCGVWSISDQYVRLFCGTFLHAGTECLVVLATHDGEQIPIEGQVLGCRHISGVDHEVTLSLTRNRADGTPIDLIRFASSPSLRRHIESVQLDGHRIDGTSLVVGLQCSTTKLAEVSLNRLGMQVHVVESETSATEWLERSDRVDLLVVDDCLGPQDSGIDAACRIRSRWMSLPMILMVIQRTAKLRKNLVTSSFMVLLEKPFGRMEIAAAARKILSLDRSAEDQVLQTKLKTDPEVGPLIDEFVQRLPESIDRIQLACHRGPVSAVAHEVRRVAEDAMIVGYLLLGEMLMQAWSSISEAANVGEARPHVEDILPLLRRLHGLRPR